MKKFSCNPIAILIWIWLLLVLGSIQAVSYVFAICLHETGHYFVAKRCGYYLNRFAISPYGVSLSYHDQNIEREDEIKIAIAGPAINLLSAIFVVGLWWIFPATYFFTEAFVLISVVLALFNLLPVFPLDGGRIFINIASYFMTVKNAKRITLIFNVILSCAFFFLFIAFLFINFNPSYLLISIFLIGGVIDLNKESKYEKVNIFCKRYKNFSSPKVLCVYQNTTLGELIQKFQNSKTFIFILILENGKNIVLNEKLIINLSLNYDYDQKLAEIINKKIY